MRWITMTIALKDFFIREILEKKTPQVKDPAN